MNNILISLEENWYAVKLFAGAALILAVGFGVAYAVDEHSKRSCIADCLDSKFRPDEKSCSFYCSWGRSREDSSTVVVPVPVSQ